MTKMNAETLMMLGGFAAFLLTLYWVRSRRIREKYAVMWVCVAIVLLLAGLFPKLIMSAADAAQLSYPAAVLFISLAVIYVFSMSVSVSLTRQRGMLVRMVQDMALLQNELDQLRKLHANVLAQDADRPATDLDSE